MLSHTLVGQLRHLQSVVFVLDNATRRQANAFQAIDGGSMQRRAIARSLCTAVVRRVAALWAQKIRGHFRATQTASTRTKSAKIIVATLKVKIVVSLRMRWRAHFLGEPQCLQGSALTDSGGNFIVCGGATSMTSTCPANYYCHYDGTTYGCCPTQAYTVRSCVQFNRDQKRSAFGRPAGSTFSPFGLARRLAYTSIICIIISLLYF